MATEVENKEQPEFCPTEAMNKEAGFFRYPANKILCVFDESDYVKAAIKDLKAGNFADEDIEVFCGQAGEKRIDFSGEGHGVWATFVRSIQSLSTERLYLEKYQKELHVGHLLLAVKTADSEKTKEAAEIIHSHNGRNVTHFGTWLIEEIAEIQKSSKAINSYGYQRELETSFAETVMRTVEALKKEGFGVLTEINMKEKLKEKLDVDFRNYLILGACNPALAYQALQEKLDLGLLLPCNVIVYEQGSGSVVAAIDAKKMLSVAQNPTLESVAESVNEKLRRAIDNV